MAKKPTDPALVPPRMTILSDHPILREDEEKARREPDSFTLHSRLGAVYDIIRHKNTRAPLAIAVYGDWGTGKSSAMRWLSDQLAEWSELSAAKREGHCRARTVWFDPWKYTKREDVWRGLIAEVILKAIDVRGASLHTVVSAARKFGLFLGRSFLNILASTELKVGGETGAAGTKAKAEAKVDLDALSKIAEDYRQTSHPEKAFLNEFETALREWVKLSLAADERMVIFIDDLDRCLPEVVLEVLEALKLYLNIPQLIFVVGLDSEVVEAVVKHHYDQHGLGKVKAEHYLDKMFQVEVDIPPSQTQMEGYLGLQIAAMDEVAGGYWSNNLAGANTSFKEIIERKIGTLAEDNPREVKRLLNSTLLRATAAARHDDLGGDDALRFTQGCQVYLMQRVLRYVPKSAGLLREHESLAFFEQWSRFIAEHPNFHNRGTQEDDEAKERHAVRRPEPEQDEADNKAYAELWSAQPRYRDEKRQPIPLLAQPDLWDLLVIPFSPEVAAAAVIDSSEEEKAPAQPAKAAPRAEVEGRAGFATSIGFDANAEVADRETGALTAMTPTLLSAIARTLRRPVDSLQPHDLLEVSALKLNGTDVIDLSPLSCLAGLQTLDLRHTQVSSLDPLSGLTLLQTLDLTDTRVSNLGPLSGLTALRSLVLVQTQVSDLTALSALTNLKELDLRSTQVSDLRPLSGLTGLQMLDISGLRVSNLGPLSALTNLQAVYLSHTQVRDLHSLAGLTALHRLDLRHTPVSDLGPLSGLTSLQTLDLEGTLVSDLEPLSGLTGLTWIDVNGSRVTDLSPLKGLRNLTVRGRW